MIVGKTAPKPKHDLHTPERWSSPQMERNMRNMQLAKRNPNEIGKLVARIKGTNFFLLLNFSSAASIADVADVGYSPPMPNPVMSLAMVSIQNIAICVLPFEQAAITDPIMIKEVVIVNPCSLPILSTNNPKNI